MSGTRGRPPVEAGPAVPLPLPRGGWELRGTRPPCSREGKSALCRPSPPPSPARRLLVGRVAASGVPHPVPPDCGSNPRCIFKCISPRNVGAWQDEGVSYSFAYKKQLKHDFYEQCDFQKEQKPCPSLTSLLTNSSLKRGRRLCTRGGFEVPQG